MIKKRGKFILKLFFFIETTWRPDGQGDASDAADAFRCFFYCQ